MKNKILLLTAVWVSLLSCADQKLETPLFELKDNQLIGIDFENNLEFSKDFNVYKYRNFYNGGGVAIGDVNNDGLQDIYMVSNQKPNQLFLNKGDWVFEDISDQAGIGGNRAWSTGVTMVDINADGYLDIYVCNSGDVKGDNRENELFINNQDLSFTQAAESYNLNDKGYSTHASFFDYDKDGDLDAYLLNNSFQAIGSFNLKKNERPIRDELGGDKLMRNDEGKFVDVSVEAGIYGSVIGFGLGITVGDVNNDRWEDIFISNDFFERDYLYINQQNGTFKEDLVNQMASVSAASMGADIADINNDGWNELFVTDMLPFEYERLKTVTTFEDWNRHQYGINTGYHSQFTRNFLHYNNGNNTFSDISRFSGVEASDWSWGALFFDMDNDGLKDLFIANGIYNDLTNQDYLQYVANESVVQSIVQGGEVDYKQLIDLMSSNPVANRSFKNEGNLNFSEYKDSGLNIPSFSNGSAYGDLDNDGDLDLVVNNVNMPSFIYENKLNERSENRYIKLVLEGEGANRLGIGAKIKVNAGDQEYHYENQPIRGFQSSMDVRPNIGVGIAETVDIEVVWPSGKISFIENAATNQVHTLKETTAVVPEGIDRRAAMTKFDIAEGAIPFEHKENLYSDFNREPLNYHMMSTMGPCVSFDDVNGDNVADLVIPGPKGMPTSVLVQGEDQRFTMRAPVATFLKNQEAEHVKCDLLDADGDGDLDLYLASGGVELTKFSDFLYDELLWNDGKGNFESSNQKLPITEERISTGAVCHSDIDDDGDIDLFIGERVKIGAFGAPCSGYLLLNDGAGNYTDMTDSLCPSMQDIGMITDAEFGDLNGDGKEDLVVVGEFMSIKVFHNEAGIFKKIQLDEELSGWWNVVTLADIDNDDDLDIIAGNHGLNSRFKADAEYPIRMYFNDFDKNGFPEGIMTKQRKNGKEYPYALRHNLTTRLPDLKKKYPDFESFKNASIRDIFSEELLDESIVHEVNELRTLLLVNKGNFSFEKRVLPYQVQLSPVYAITAFDYNEDGHQDLIMGGNLHNVQPEMGRYDASYGHILQNDGKGNFTDVSKDLGFSVNGEIRDIVIQDNIIHVFRNHESALTFKINK